MKHRELAVSLAALGGILAAGCGVTRAGVETAAAQAFISDEDENKIGLQVKGELEKKSDFHYMDDAAINEYVQNVAARVIEPAKKDRQGVDWHVYVIDDSKTVNAFATPGGHLYVYSGLVLLADNEAELAGVLAHEAGHVVGRHSARQMVNAYGLQAVSNLALGRNPNLLAQLGTTIAAKGLLLAHSRSEETEADEYGAKYAAAAGYEPAAIGTFFEKLMAKEGRTPAILTILSDHPATQDRIAHVKDYVQKNNLTGTETGADKIAPIKKRIAARPAPSPKAGGGVAPGGAPSGAPAGGAPSGGTQQQKPPAGAPPGASPN